MPNYNDHLRNLPDNKMSSKKSTLAPTSGKHEFGKKLCDAEVDHLNLMMREVQSAYDKFREAVDIKRELIQNTANVATRLTKKDKINETSDFVVRRIESGLAMADKMLVEIKKVLNPMDISKLMMAVNPLPNLDFAILSTDFWEYAGFLLKVQSEAAKIKIKYAPTLKKILVTGNRSGDKINTPEVVGRTFTKNVYRMELRAVLPDNTEIQLHQYISQFMYSVDFDEAAMPIYSAIMKLPQTILMNLKNHFERTKFYLTIKMFEKKGERSEYRFEVPVIVLDNIPLIGVDPKFPSLSPQKAGGEAEHLPLYDVKIDFVAFREQLLNGKVKAKVYNDCTVADVIAGLCSDLNEIYRKKQMDTRREVKFAVSPPENNTTYEQIMVAPGSFMQAINDLQTKYGIYQTGVRVQFDNNQAILNNKKQETTPVVTIKDKGGLVPVKDAMFTNVIIEVVAPKATTTIGFESGSFLTKSTQTLTIRTDLPYNLDKVNSTALTKGQAIRVQNSSSDDHVYSICDDDTADEDKWKFYWSKYNNQFALSQIQDSVREKNLQCTLQVNDVNIMTLNDNVNYILKFFSPDDETATGEYRLSKAQYFFKQNNVTSDKFVLEISGTLHFKNLRPLRLNGTEAPRTSYGAKLANAMSERSYNYDLSYSDDGLSTGSVGGPSAFKLKSDDKFGGSNFYGKKDYYGVPFLPTGVPGWWNMGGGFTFAQTINTVDGGSEVQVQSITSNLNYFLNAQKFMEVVIGPITQMCGRFIIDGGAMKSFYRTTSGRRNGDSAHLQGLAADIRPVVLGKQIEYTTSFLKIANSGIPYDQIILEGNGSSWMFIHISLPLNGAVARKKAYVNLSTNKANELYDVTTMLGLSPVDYLWEDANIHKSLANHRDSK